VSIQNIKPGYKNELSLKNKTGRFVWFFTWMLLFRPTPHWCLNRWRFFLLRCMGAKIPIIRGSIRPTCRIWAPWNLEIAPGVAIDESVFLYCVAPIKVGLRAVISREAFLCTASHDIHSNNRKLITAPIIIGDYVWVAARAFIGPGVTIGEGAVVGACAVVTRDVEPWTVVAGNPARFIKKREIREQA